MKFNQFLIKAKKATYASDKEENILPDGCKELVYEEDNLKYRDRYFGTNPFLGEEIVFEEGKAIWGMNYVGKVLFDKISPKEIYGFLKKALSNVTEDLPFRGPEEFKEGDFEYSNKIKGDLDFFNGLEEIKFSGEVVYRLYYNGGKIN